MKRSKLCSKTGTASTVAIAASSINALFMQHYCINDKRLQGGGFGWLPAIGDTRTGRHGRRMACNCAADASSRSTAVFRAAGSLDVFDAAEPERHCLAPPRRHASEELAAGNWLSPDMPPRLIRTIPIFDSYGRHRHNDDGGATMRCFRQPVRPWSRCAAPSEAAFSRWRNNVYATLGATGRPQRLPGLLPAPR